ncbi:MAG: hypothetical protein HY906_15785 [Deltaproteobacteria bacterium]|nr:hypothetical protein [Deltaproteobacteria bacterium]
MRALAYRAAVLLAVASAVLACGSGASVVDAQADLDCLHCCEFGSVWCSAPIGYYATDGSPALAPGVEGWFLQWRVGQGIAAPAFGELLLWGEVYGRAELPIIIDRPPADGIDPWHQCEYHLDPRAVWAKIRGRTDVAPAPVRRATTPSIASSRELAAGRTEQGGDGGGSPALPPRQSKNHLTDGQSTG